MAIADGQPASGSAIGPPLDRYSDHVANDLEHPLQQTSLSGVRFSGIRTLADPQASHWKPSWRIFPLPES